MSPNARMQDPKPERPEHARPPAGLADWLATLIPAQEPAIRLDEVQGVPLVVKRRRPSLMRGLSYAVRYMRAALLAIGCRLVLGEFPSPRLLVHNGLDHEARRLRDLDAANWRVPHVWSHVPGELVLEFVGDDLPGLLRRSDRAAQEALVSEVASELAAFHRQGLWHGGSQVRNLTWHEGAIWRIDFEENIGGALSLPLAQAYDVYQCLSSLVALRALPEETSIALGERLLSEYLAQNADPRVRQALMRMAGLLRTTTAVLRPVLGWVPGRDVQGFFRVSHTLRLLWNP